MERIDTVILGRDYSLACPLSEKDKLLSAVKLVDKRMQIIKETGKIAGNERIAVMAAIQIANELLSAKAPDGPLSTLAFGDFKRKIEDMHTMLDSAIGSNK